MARAKTHVFWPITACPAARGTQKNSATRSARRSKRRSARAVSCFRASTGRSISIEKKSRPRGWIFQKSRQKRSNFFAAGPKSTPFSTISQWLSSCFPYKIKQAYFHCTSGFPQSLYFLRASCRFLPLSRSNLRWRWGWQFCFFPATVSVPGLIKAWGCLFYRRSVCPLWGCRRSRWWSCPGYRAATLGYQFILVRWW